MQQSVVGEEMLLNHKWNDEMVKGNNGNEYVVNIGSLLPQLNWLHALMQPCMDLLKNFWHLNYGFD